MSTANSPSSHDSLISLTSLYKAVSRFASTTDHRELLKEIVAVAAQQMSADNVTFHEYDPGAQQFYDIDHSVTYGATSSLQRPREKGGGSAYVIEQGEYIVEDVSKEDPTLVGTKHMAEEGVKAFFGIRLQVDGDIVGVLLINYNKPHQFSEAEKVVARILAGYASNAIRNARQGRLQALSQVGRKLASTLTDYQGLLKEIVAVVAQQIGADNVTLHQYDPVARQFYDVERSVTYGATSPLQRPREKGGVSAYVIEQGEYVVGDVSKEDPIVVGTTHLAEEEVKAFLGIRLQVGEDIVGVLLINYDEPHRFSEDENAVVTILADYASIAIRNARRYEHLQVLSRIGSRLASTVTDYQGLLKEIQTVVAQEMRADNVTLHQYDPVARQFYDVERSVTYGATSPLQRPREKGGVSAYVIEQGEYVVGDVSKEDPIVVGTTHLAEEEVKAFLGIRLQVGEDIVGVLLINYDEPHRFSEDEETVARTIAAYASIVIHQQREQAKRLEAEKETAIHEFATKLAHAAVNKVSLARLAALRLLEDSSLSLSPSQRDKLETIVSSAEIANGVIRNFIEPLREVTPEWVSVLKLMKEALHIVGEPTEAKIQIGSLPEHPLVFIEKRGAVIIFSELIINALKAISRSQKRASQGLIEIASSFAPDIGFMEITFSNNGPSIPREYWEKIFEGIVVETSGGVQKGSGLGLWSAREFMQKHGGDVLLKESNDNKTTFVVRLPVSSS